MGVPIEAQRAWVERQPVRDETDVLRAIAKAMVLEHERLQADVDPKEHDMEET